MIIIESKDGRTKIECDIKDIVIDREGIKVLFTAAEYTIELNDE